MRIAIVGSRTFKDPERAKNTLYLAIERIAAKHPEAVIISGGAKGADLWAKEAATKFGLEYKEFPADWDKHGRVAGFLRNSQIVEDCTHVLAFWNGTSNGTMDTVTKAKAAHKHCVVWDEGNMNP